MGKNRKLARQKVAAESEEPLVDISEAEQWRIIQESGILHKITKDEDEPATTAEDEDNGKLSPFAEEMFSAINLIIPHCFLLLMMDILVHYQYGRHPTYGVLLERMLPSIPILSVFIFYTARYKALRRMQAFLFVLSLGMGTRLIYLINTANWLVVMKQCPPLAVIWIYCIVQLNLGPAVVSLTVVYGWVYYKKMKLFF